jgi:hypothetical protein
MYMNENAVKEKVQKVYFEPRAPEELIQSVILRAKAVTMGLEAQKQLATAPAEKVGELASRALIGQLATLSELPKNAQPEQLAQQLQQEPAFMAALRGGHVARRIQSGELMQQVAGQTPAAKEEPPQIEAPVKELPKLPGLG